MLIPLLPSELVIVSSNIVFTAIDVSMRLINQSMIYNTIKIQFVNENIIKNNNEADVLGWPWMRIPQKWVRGVERVRNRGTNAILTHRAFTLVHYTILSSRNFVSLYFILLQRRAYSWTAGVIIARSWFLHSGLPAAEARSISSTTL